MVLTKHSVEHYFYNYHIDTCKLETPTRHFCLKMRPECIKMPVLVGGLGGVHIGATSLFTVLVHRFS